MEQRIPLYPIALTAALLPLLSIHLSYLWAATNGHVEWCLPYIQSCTSISATGRQAPEFYLFKALMIPSAVMLGIYWWLSSRWLLSLGCKAQRARRLLVVLGLGSALGLILYSVMLGAIGDLYQLQRRIGVISFFGLSYIAQLIITRLLSEVDSSEYETKRGIQALKGCALLILLVGLSSVALSALDHDYYESKDDAFEWTLTLLLCIHVLVTAGLWKKTGFVSELQTNQ